MDITLDISASGNKRVLNYLIDTLAFIFVNFVFGIIAGFIYSVFHISVSPFHYYNVASWQGMLWLMFFWLLYYFIMEFFWQQTIGKFFTGTKVITVNDKEPGFAPMLLRTLLRPTPFGFLYFNEFKIGKTLHDRLSGTVVIDRKKYAEAAMLKDEFDQIGVNTEQ
ncbi:RDD family protein [Flavobacterium rhizosphaerae]|uniref:RDD family protein n=1 Tax=Flavobacterium rhizosphaerae TaxID=3163298 RepID=A0ABW8YWC0_9FLAO